jgi:hypothetical protein
MNSFHSSAISSHITSGRFGKLTRVLRICNASECGRERCLGVRLSLSQPRAPLNTEIIQTRLLPFMALISMHKRIGMGDTQHHLASPRYR